MSKSQSSVQEVFSKEACKVNLACLFRKYFLEKNFCIAFDSNTVSTPDEDVLTKLVFQLSQKQKSFSDGMALMKAVIQCQQFGSDQA